jgi:CRP-like cAMP-binding protein
MSRKLETFLDFCLGHNFEIFEHNKVLFKEGDKKSIFYVLLDGKIEISKGGVNVAIVTNRGALIGEMAAILGVAHTATCRSVGDAKAYAFLIDQNFLKDNPAMLLLIAQDLAKKLLKLTASLVEQKSQPLSEGMFEQRRRAEQIDSILAELYDP